MPRIVLFEMNEVPWTVIDYYVSRRPASALARLCAKSRKYETVTEDKGELSPWITWPTLHRGVANDKHYIGELGQPLKDVNKAYPPVWELLAKGGIKVGLCGSLHSYPPPPSYEGYAFHVPDIFASGAECHPPELTPFQAFCLKMARESPKNVSSRVPLEAAALLKSLPHLGITPTSMADVAGQLVSERVNKHRVVRRRTYQSVLAFDVFMRQLEKTKPDFSTFFTNHVASAMHRYWAATFPEHYEKVPFDSEWMHTYGGEILFAMDKADRMLGRVADFVDRNPGYELMVASSMGQEAVVTEPMETMLYPKNAARFLEVVGVKQWEPRPAMVPDFNIHSTDPDAGERLARVTINGKPFEFHTGEHGFYTLKFGGYANLKSLQVCVDGSPVSDHGLENTVIQDKSGVSAYHIPKGSLLIYGRGPAEKTQVSTLDVAPHILRNYGLGVPQYMSGTALA